MNYTSAIVCLDDAIAQVHAYLSYALLYDDRSKIGEAKRKAIMAHE